MASTKFEEKYRSRPNPYLVQRLHQPTPTAFGNKRADQVFSFGGGGSGLTDDAWELLKPLFQFDYMGAAEFEFGALPKSLGPFSKAELIKFELILHPDEIEPNWHRRYSKTKATIPPLTEDKTVYVICRKEDQEFVSDAIRGYAKNAIYVKESVQLSNALDPLDEYDSKNCGWYELQNGFFFFTDKSMWERTSQLFLGE